MKPCGFSLCKHLHDTCITVSCIYILYPDCSHKLCTLVTFIFYTNMCVSEVCLKSPDQTSLISVQHFTLICCLLQAEKLVGTGVT